MKTENKIEYDRMLRRYVFGHRLFKSVAEAKEFYKKYRAHAKREGWRFEFEITYWDVDGALHDVREWHEDREALEQSLQDRGITQYFLSEAE